jgi:hypothetical protein
MTEEYEYTNAPQQDYNYESEGTGSAAFFTLGATATFTPGLWLSATYRSDFEYEIDDRQRTWEFADGSVNWEYQDDLEYDVPSYLAAGVLYEVSPSVTIVGELQSRPFADFEADGNKFVWIDNGLCYRAGAEFLTSSAAIRMGLFSDAVLATDAPLTEESPKHLTGITGGVGFEAGQVDLDFFGEISWWNGEYEINYRSYDYSETRFAFGITAGLEIR